MTDLWTWIGTLQGAQAQVTGAFSGAFFGMAFGIVSLVIGALINAWLNRRRDNNIRKQDTAGLAVALKGELAVIRNSLQMVPKTAPDKTKDILIPDPRRIYRIFPQVASKLGLLDAITIANVISTYGSIDALYQRLFTLGGIPYDKAPISEGIVKMPVSSLEVLNKDIEALLKQIAATGSRLDYYDQRVFFPIEKIQVI